MRESQIKVWSSVYHRDDPWQEEMLNSIIDVKFLLNTVSYLFMCLSVRMNATCVQGPLAKRGHRWSYRHCKLPDGGAENQTGLLEEQQVLFNS